MWVFHYRLTCFVFAVASIGWLFVIIQYMFTMCLLFVVVIVGRVFVNYSLCVHYVLIICCAHYLLRVLMIVPYVLNICGWFAVIMVCCVFVNYALCVDYLLTVCCFHYLLNICWLCTMCYLSVEYLLCSYVGEYVLTVLICWLCICWLMAMLIVLSIMYIIHYLFTLCWFIVVVLNCWVCADCSLFVDFLICYFCV